MTTTTNHPPLEAIDPSQNQWKSMLENLQGNILKGHGRDNAWHLFLHFEVQNPRNINEIRAWMKTLNITTALEQITDTDCFKKLIKIEEKDRTKEEEYELKKLSSKIVSFFFLSHSGYKALDVDTADWLTDSSFKNGMKQQLDLQDPASETWDFSTSDSGGQRIDAMLLIASDDLKGLDAHRQNLILPSCTALVHAQFGETLRINNTGLEHFGYADGVSQPLMLTDNKRKKGKLWDDEVSPLEMALVEDKSVPDAKKVFGSYFVFRKLDQNVKDFKEAEENLGLGEIGGAYVVGRFEDGTPVAKYAEEQHPTSENELENDFDYKNDASAHKCPFHAHIRVTNPRDIQETGKVPIRVVRRGITYDEAGRGGNLDWHPEGKVGLLFMCYQKSIVDQFEVLQIRWANNGNISLPKKQEPHRQVAIDGLIGQGKREVPQQEYPLKWNEKTKVSNCNFSGFVTMKGGEYFFAPAIPFFN